MHIDNWKPLGNRAGRYAASTAIRIATAMLWRSHQLYRAGILDLAGARYAIHWSNEVWTFGWRLIKPQRRLR